MKLLLLLLVILLTSGCSSIQLTQKQKKALPGIAKALQQAEQLRKQKRYSDAEDLLSQARKNHPESQKAKQRLEQIQAERTQYQQLMEDKLLAVRFTLVQQQRALLTQLANSEADDLMIRFRLRQLNGTWLKGRPQLSRCGKRQLTNAQATAEKCLQLALSIEEQQSDRKHLTQITQKKAQAAKKTEQKKRETAIQQLLEQAYRKQEDGKHHEALLLLEQLLELAPESAHIINLRNKIQKELEGHTQQLLIAGEALYQRGRLEDAIAIWNTLLLLNPQHKQALQKAKRAQRVLGNLQQLRQQQKLESAQ